MFLYLYGVMGILRGEEVWKDTVFIDGDVVVEEGGSLIILPGTVVLFSLESNFDDSLGTPQKCDLIVKGRLIAQGTKLKKIIFDRAEYEYGKWWGEIRILNAENELYKHWIIRGSAIGLQIEVLMSFWRICNLREPITMPSC